jgi:hypothetical protein
MDVSLMLARTYILISDLVMRSSNTLDERLVDLLKLDGGRKTLAEYDAKVYDIHNSNGFSGYNYWVENTLVGQLQIASLTSGSYAIYKRVFMEDEITEIYDYYDQDGNFSYSSNQLDCPVVTYNSVNMEPLSPTINHLYNALHAEYEKARKGNSLTARIVLLEGMLNNYFNDPEVTISAQNKRHDQAIKNIEKEVFRIEADPVLTWPERQDIFTSLKEIRKIIIDTKMRVHNLNLMNYGLPIVANDLLTKMKLIIKRPGSNLRGISYKWTFGQLFWFLGSVKENLGYSVALAIYGPFTFYFITQPMNPHAMWAVGKVRNAYISTVDSIESGLSNTAEVEKVKKMIAKTQQVQDQVSTTQSSISKPLVSIPTKKINWDDRMSNFKAMQIAYEGNMVFAARMGRLEQMESQFNFPLTAESAWDETQRYIRSVNNTIKFNQNIDSRFKNFLTKEVERAQELQVYIWKKMGQFFLDHPYIVVDEKNEQDQRDYYVGKSFVFMNEMTEALSKRDSTLVPVTHNKIKALSKFYKQSKIQGVSIIDSLKKNSKLFAQKDLFSTTELRDYMENHWEVLFLQQNKKQEASSFALQTYTWSIKNAIWTMQSIYSAKREELNTLAFKFNLNNQNTGKVKAEKEIDDLLESMMHMLTMEYVSIKEEFSKNIKFDEESVLREKMIKNVKDYLVERDALFNSTQQVANSKNSATTKI